MELKDADPKGLVRESYAIEGITAPECRSIFMDWALSLPAGITAAAAIPILLATYAPQPGHPMTVVLNAGLAAGPAPARRGGRAGRFNRGSPVLGRDW